MDCLDCHLDADGICRVRAAHNPNSHVEPSRCKYSSFKPDTQFKTKPSNKPDPFDYSRSWRIA
jgi:hypothetical protein